MIISRHERVVDSLPAPEVKDTIAVVLRTLQDRVTSDRIGIYDRAWNEGMRLRYSNELVNTKIYRLIMDFEAEDTAFLMNRFEQTEAIRRRSSLTLGVIGRRGRGAHVAVRRHPVARHQPQQPLPAGAGAGQPRQRSAAGGRARS